VDGKPNATLTDTWGMHEEPRRAREGAVEDDRRARVVLADDDVLLREGLASLLERSGFEVVGQAGDASQLLTLVREQEPDIAIIDIRMPPDYGIEGLDAARVIRKEFPKSAILVLSAHVEVDHAMELLAGGDRVGYLLKSRVTDVSDFIESVDRIARGGSVVDPGLVHELVAARRRHDPLEALTPREREVLALMAEGYSNAGICQAAVRERRHGREARAQHPPQAPAPGDGGRTPTRPGGHHLPGSSLTIRRRADASPLHAAA
jgi:DNA-binding NarL/FixJ family response regulator